MTELDGKSMDIKAENIAKMQQLFPEAFEEGKVDFDKLHQLLGDYVDDARERYNFTWNGKGRALHLSQTPSMGTLRPCQEESKDWDTTQNLYIEGDNLEVLKLLQKSYHNKVKMIYIDPPYNTGNDFVYKDDFKDSIENYKEITGQLDSEGRVLGTQFTGNRSSNGRFHTDWLNMMYPRLRLARNLLADDGVMFMSIDEHEINNMQRLCDEVFGEQNYGATFLWTKTSTPPALSNKCRKTVEYVLAYEKKISNQKYFGSMLDNGDAPLLNTGNPIKTLSFMPHTIQIYFLDNGIISKGKKEKVNLKTDLIVKNAWNENEVTIEGEFKWEQSTLNQEISNGTYFIVKTEKFSVRFQRNQQIDAFKTPNNFLDIALNKNNGVGTNESAVQELTKLDLFNAFDYAKPVSLLEILLKMVTQFDKDALVLDFFSGSATTAHAVMKLNNEDGGQRKYIMVQIPEPTDEKSEAYKAGYKNICEIGKERIRRAGEKIKAECAAGGGISPSSLDIGFKVFKLDTSNLKKWQPDGKNDEQLLLDSVDNFAAGRTELDMVYEIMLKMGLDMSYPVEEEKISGKKVYVIGAGALMICLADQITIPVAEGMAKLHAELAPEVWKVVFKDNGFASDSDKTNSREILKCAGLEEDAFTTI